MKSFERPSSTIGARRIFADLILYNIVRHERRYKSLAHPARRYRTARFSWPDLYCPENITAHKCESAGLGWESLSCPIGGRENPTLLTSIQQWAKETPLPQRLRLWTWTIGWRDCCCCWQPVCGSIKSTADVCATNKRLSRNLESKSEGISCSLLAFQQEAFSSNRSIDKTDGACVRTVKIATKNCARRSKRRDHLRNGVTNVEGGAAVLRAGSKSRSDHRSIKTSISKRPCKMDNIRPRQVQRKIICSLDPHTRNAMMVANISEHTV